MRRFPLRPTPVGVSQMSPRWHTFDDLAGANFHNVTLHCTIELSCPRYIAAQ